jgi:hypothetical protein
MERNKDGIPESQYEKAIRECGQGIVNHNDAKKAVEQATSLSSQLNAINYAAQAKRDSIRYKKAASIAIRYNPYGW